jgi:hypothetical protein
MLLESTASPEPVDPPASGKAQEPVGREGVALLTFTRDTKPWLERFNVQYLELAKKPPSAGWVAPNKVQGSKEDSHGTSLLSLCGLPRDTLV